MRKVMMLVVASVTLGWAAPAMGDTTISVESRSPCCGEFVFHDIVYRAGTWSNDVTVVDVQGQLGVALTDPGVQMRSLDNRLPVGVGLYIPGSGPTIPVFAGWTCITPGNTVATCTAAPGSMCWTGGCAFPAGGSFTGYLKLFTGGGNDRVRVSRLSMPSIVNTGEDDDTIDMANGVGDAIACGTGADAVIADVADNVNADCESVERR